MSSSLLRVSADERFPVRSDCPYEFLSHLETEIPEQDKVFRKHVKVVALSIAGYSPRDIAKYVGYSLSHVLNILHDYNDRFFWALIDNRKKNSAEYGELVVRLLQRTATRCDMHLSEQDLYMLFPQPQQALPSSPSQQCSEEEVFEDPSDYSDYADYVETSARQIPANSGSERNGKTWMLLGAVVSFVFLVLVFLFAETDTNHNMESPNPATPTLRNFPQRNP